MLGVVKTADMLGQPQPGDLEDIGRVRRAEAVGARHRPDQPAELLHQCLPRGIVAARGGLDQITRPPGPLRVGGHGTGDRSRPLAANRSSCLPPATMAFPDPFPGFNNNVLSVGNSTASRAGWSAALHT